MSKKLLIKELLSDSSYWTLNKTVVKIFGIETALLLAVFSDAETMMSDKEGWFYQTTETIEKITGLTRYKQDQSINALEKAGILQKQVKGIPAKRYFKLDYKILSNKIVNNLQTRTKETGELDCKKLATSKESINKESNKESNNKYTDPEKEQKKKEQREKEKAKEDQLNKEFEELWAIYPNKRGKDNARKKYKTAIKDGHTYDQVKNGIENYLKEIQFKRTSKEYILHGSTFFNQRRWNDDFMTGEENDIEAHFKRLEEENNNAYTDPDGYAF